MIEIIIIIMCFCLIFIVIKDLFLKKHIPEGLNYNIEHLENIKFDIIFYDRFQQSKYADNILKNIIDNKYTECISFLSMHFTDFENYNTTSIGNLAYISLYCSCDIKKKQANDILIQFKLHYEKNIN